MSDMPRTKYVVYEPLLPNCLLGAAHAIRHNAPALWSEADTCEQGADRIRSLETALARAEVERDSAVTIAERAEHRANQAETERDAARGNEKRYLSFRAVMSSGNLTKRWRDAAEKWFAKYYPEADLDAAIDAARKGEGNETSSERRTQ